MRMLTRVAGQLVHITLPGQRMGIISWQIMANPLCILMHQLRTLFLCVPSLTANMMIMIATHILERENTSCSVCIIIMDMYMC